MNLAVALAALAALLLGAAAAIQHGLAEYWRGRCETMERERSGLISLLDHGTTGQTAAPPAHFGTGQAEPEGAVVEAETARRRELVESAKAELMRQARESGVALNEENAYKEAERILQAVGAV